MAAQSRILAWEVPRRGAWGLQSWWRPWLNTGGEATRRQGLQEALESGLWVPGLWVAATRGR